MGKKLFSDDEEKVGFKVNKEYAEKYERTKKYMDELKIQDLMRLKKDKGLSESSTEEDELGLMDAKNEKEFVRVMALLSKKDSTIYQKDVQFFQDKGEVVDDEEKVVDETKVGEKKKKEMTISDYVRENLMEYGSKGLEPEEIQRGKGNDRDLKQEFLNASEKKTLGEEGEMYDSEEIDDILIKKKKGVEELRQEKEKINFLALEQKELEKKKKFSEMDILNEYWKNSSSNLNENEKFLRNYILNNGWLNNEYSLEEEQEDEEQENEEEFIRKQEKYEEKKQMEMNIDCPFGPSPQPSYRFEEEDGAEIKSFSRKQDQSLRKKESRRKLERERRKERAMEREEEEKREVKRLKNVLKSQIQEKAEKVKDIAGISQELNIDPNFFYKDYNPDEYSKMMDDIFNDDYYNSNDNNFKPKDTKDIVEKMDEEMDEEDINEEDINEDDEKDKKELIEKVKEYNDLDYEDIRGGVKFKMPYIKVKPRSYGMSIDDMLKPEKELNKRVNLKWLSPYRETSKNSTKKKKNINKLKNKLK